ncbi:sulfurtransferase TusA family protein [Acinetobacter pollinis]|uniref:Sulfurtransferase TusA family protein n=1 Tax=Acinetobacter pollinis TaxID=2605270 RepID=A0ABU6DUF5_9GAMM|nr:sulfurtransferase TusA family protein [Acinetobacter pollinis]MEB5477491.1 sulfurtransferase TusA family protein [Acinetobacter pollinis]
MNPSEDSLYIDAMDKPCPMPLLMLKRALKNALPEQKIRLHASDPNSEIDILRYCQIHKLICDTQQISEYEYCYIIQRKV